MEAGKRIGRAFIVGAVMGLIGQILMNIFGAFVPADFVTPVAMIVFGIISAGVILSGLYFKVAKFGGDGAAIPLTGLMFGAAMAAGGEKAKGASNGKAFLKGFVTIITVLGIGFVICFVLGLILK